MKNLIFVKIGGSILTDKTKPFTINTENVHRLAKEIHEARTEKKIKLIIGHGGGSFPHIPASKYRTAEGIIDEKSYEGISVVQDAASQLNRIFVDALLKAGENAISVQPSASCIANKKRIVEWYTKPIEQMLEFDLLPVPYGDVALDLNQGCCIISTEEILNFLAKKFMPDKIITVGEVDGVFTDDPHKNPNAKLIPEINSKNFEEVKKYLKGSRGIDVTGGMLHRVEEMFELVDLGFETIIINGNKPGYLKKALLGEEVLGTTIRK
jgi:isopentenyl phosphate kinase